MGIFGYDREDHAATTPMTLSEVTFQLPPEALRTIARFLAGQADEIESGQFTDGGRHLSDADPTWPVDDQGDVIIVPPQTPAAPPR